MQKLFAAMLILSMALASMPVVHAQTETLSLTACPFEIGIGTAKTSVDAKCGVFNVPEDRQNASSRRIDLHVVVLPALKANATGLPIFHLEGGPGASAITNFGQTWYASYLGFRQNHPVVLIDQRGTGLSASLQCTEITKSALSDLAKISDPQADQAESEDRLSKCLTRLSATNDPKFYTSDAMADDTDAIRAALGYDQILVFGNSYGTWLGQYLLKRHGEHVAGMVLDSVTGPWNAPSAEAPRNVQASLDSVFALCKADPACDRAFPDLPGQLQIALKKLQDKPVIVNATSGVTNKTYPVGMTADKLLAAVFQMLYNSANASLIPQTIAEAARGGYTFSGSVLATYAEQAADAISIGLNYSVECAEEIPFLTSEQVAKSKEGVFGDLLDPKSTVDACKKWRSAELNDAAPITSDRPVLILSGGLDPVTPVRFGEETQRRLSHSTLAVFPYQAHGVIVNSGCARRVVAAFFDAPTQPVDTSCIPNDTKPVFLGAYSIELTPFNDPSATFAGTAPKGWKAEQDGALTFFTSPDGVQVAAGGIFKKQKVDVVRKTVLDQIIKRFGGVVVQQETTVSMLFISITAVVHSVDLPKDAGVGILYLRPQGDDVYVVWQAAPSNIFQAVSLALTPQMLGTMRGR